MLSSETLSEINRLVNYAIGRVVTSWRLNEDEREDVRQDALTAAIESYRRFDPNRGRKLGNWLLDRIIGQVKDSVRRLRNGGIVGGAPIVLPMDGVPALKDAEPSDGQPGAMLSLGEYGGSAEPIEDSAGPDERAETAAAMEILGECLGTVDKRVLAVYYGLAGGPELTISELAVALKCSRKHAFNLLQRARRNAKRALCN